MTPNIDLAIGAVQSGSEHLGCKPTEKYAASAIPHSECGSCVHKAERLWAKSARRPSAGDDQTPTVNQDIQAKGLSTSPRAPRSFGWRCRVDHNLQAATIHALIAIAPSREGAGWRFNPSCCDIGWAAGFAALHVGQTAISENEDLQGLMQGLHSPYHRGRRRCAPLV